MKELKFVLLSYYIYIYIYIYIYLLSCINYFYTIIYRYDVMIDCWKAEPDERPSFEILQEKLTKILRDQVRNVQQRWIGLTYLCYNACYILSLRINRCFCVRRIICARCNANYRTSERQLYMQQQLISLNFFLTHFLKIQYLNKKLILSIRIRALIFYRILQEKHWQIQKCPDVDLPYILQGTKTN